MKENGDQRGRKSLREDGGNKNIYCICGMENLLTLCNFLYRADYDEESSVYRDTDKNIFYLIAAEGFGHYGLPIYPMLREYSFLTLQLARFVSVVEHCTSLCGEDAVKTLGKLL